MYAALLQQQRQQCSRSQAIAARIFAQRHAIFMQHSRQASSRSNVAEKLLLEDLETPAAVRCQRQSQSQSPRPSFVTLPRPQLAALRSHDDYRIYQQNVDLEAFFGDEQRYEKVSDVCLLNDHYILVKMPKLESPTLQPKAVPKKQPSSSKLPRCFKCSRSRRVSPILEELEDEPQSTQTPWTASDEVEVFESSTRIISAAQLELQRSAAAPVIVEQPQSNSFATALQHHQQTTQLQLQHLPVAPQPPPVIRGALYWFLWPFRWRSESRPKQAAVHKTYFVRWTKPPDPLWHGYGMERLDKVQLRRCRSAVF